MEIKTSTSDPLRIDSVRPQQSTGRVGMTLCPGKTDPRAVTASWDRDLDMDLERAVEWGASVIVSLVEDHEFRLLQVPSFGAAVVRHGMKWLHLPIPDQQSPGPDFETNWFSGSGREIKRFLDDELDIVLHCRGGLGRTGTVAAKLLFEYGEHPERAINLVREARRDEHARKNTIENEVQEEYVRNLTRRLSDPMLDRP